MHKIDQRMFRERMLTRGWQGRLGAGGIGREKPSWQRVLRAGGNVVSLGRAFARSGKMVGDLGRVAKIEQYWGSKTGGFLN